MHYFNEIKKNLSEGQTIKNWTILKGYFGEDFDIVQISDNRITVNPFSASLRTVTAKDFIKIAEIWDDYLTMKIRRKNIMTLTHNSKYVISILHHVYK